MQLERLMSAPHLRVIHPGETLPPAAPQAAPTDEELLSPLIRDVLQSLDSVKELTDRVLESPKEKDVLNLGLACAFHMKAVTQWARGARTLAAAAEAAPKENPETKEPGARELLKSFDWLTPETWGKEDA